VALDVKKIQFAPVVESSFPPAQYYVETGVSTAAWGRTTYQSEVFAAPVCGTHLPTLELMMNYELAAQCFLDNSRPAVIMPLCHRSTPTGVSERPVFAERSRIIRLRSRPLAEQLRY